MLVFEPSFSRAQCLVSFLYSVISGHHRREQKHYPGPDRADHPEAAHVVHHVRRALQALMRVVDAKVRILHFNLYRDTEREKRPEVGQKGVG